MNIGVIGLGIIGSRMAKNWQRAGHRVVGWNRTRAHAEGLGIPLAETPAVLAEKSELVVIVVADPPAVKAVLSGPNGVTTADLHGKVVINASTVGAADNREAEKAVSAAGGEFLETPFTGSKSGAEAGTLVFFVGGNPAVLKRVEPVLLQTGSKVLYFGPTGAASDVKLALNMMAASAVQAMAEAFNFVKLAGVDLQGFIDAYRHNMGWSQLAELKAPKMLTGDFSPHFALKHMDKDLRLFVERAAELNLCLRHAAALKRIFSDAMNHGWGDEDYSVLQRLAGENAGSPSPTR